MTTACARSTTKIGTGVDTDEYKFSAVPTSDLCQPVTCQPKRAARAVSVPAMPAPFFLSKPNTSSIFGDLAVL